MEGTVKFFNKKKGFGFIQGNDGKDYFVHVSGLAEHVFLRDNDKVSFNAAEGERGMKAENVKLLQKGSERSDVQPEKREEAAEEQEESEDSEEDNSDEDRE